jgi:predicted RNase H-like HicB family nuclease
MAESLAYAVVFESGTNNWSAYVPDLPGCVATGKTRAETEKNIRAAIELHLRGMRKDGDAIPPPTCEVGMVSVAA